jgi:hypothetical protein
MVTAATAKPIQTRAVQPAISRDVYGQRPTETRYGWCPYGNINLRNADGTMNLYVQPHEIEENGIVVPNPYHFELPKGQLIPFPTFPVIEQMPSPDLTDSMGRSVLVSSTRTMTALDAAVTVLRRYSMWGFTILNSLQGMDQDIAFRIFAVVHPLEFRMADLENELSFGAEARIDANEPITFANVPNYSVEPLRNEQERDIARKVAEEMLVGAGVAVALATTTLNDTKTSLTTRFAGGQGKTGPDPLDRRLSEELGEELPKLVGTNPNANPELEKKVDYLVTRETSRELQDENARLKAELEALKNGKQPEASSGEQEVIGENKIGETETADALPPLSIGATALLDGQNVTVFRKLFGKYEVKYDDGTTATVERDELS